MPKISHVLIVVFVCAVATVETNAATGKVSVLAPTGNTFSGPIHYVAAATTTCAKGVSAMGIYTAYHVRVYTVNGAKLDTTITLKPGKYNTVVQEWDNCGTSAWATVPITVLSSVPPPTNWTTTLAAQTGNNTSTAGTFAAQSNGNLGATNVSKVDIHSLLYPGATT